MPAAGISDSARKLNWNRARMDARKPITLLTSKRVGEILRHVDRGVTPAARYAFTCELIGAELGHGRGTARSRRSRKRLPPERGPRGAAAWQRRPSLAANTESPSRFLPRHTYAHDTYGEVEGSRTPTAASTQPLLLHPSGALNSELANSPTGSRNRLSPTSAANPRGCEAVRQARSAVAPGSGPRG
jgi:hypothetical protein